MNSFNLLFYILTNNLRYLSTYDYLRYHYYSNMSMNFVKMPFIGVAYADPQNPILKNLKKISQSCNLIKQAL